MPATMKTITEFLQQGIDEQVFPGAVWVIGNMDSILEYDAAGVLGQGLGPVSRDSLFDIASLTKIVVTVALLRQLEDGLVQLEDTVGDFLAPFRSGNKAAITIRELLTHTSALPSLEGLHAYARTKTDILEAIRLCPVRQELPRLPLYTCEGFILLGEILAAIDGIPLDSVIYKRVTSPLAMHDTMYNPPPSQIERCAAAEHSAWRNRLVHGEVHDGKAFRMGGISGNAGLFSTAGDMAKLCQNMLRSLRGGGLLHRASAALSIQNHTPQTGQNRGLGWQLAGHDTPAGDLMARTSFGHTGFTGVSIWIDYETELYSVLFTNHLHFSRDRQHIARYRKIFHNLSVVHYADKNRND